VRVPVPMSPEHAGADEPTRYSMLKVLAPEGTPIIRTLLALSPRVNAPPIAIPLEKFKEAKQGQFCIVAVPVNAKFCPSEITAVKVGGMVSGLDVEFMVPERVPAGELL
jgi:hypothetical protein